MGKNVLVLLAEGFEEVETVTPIDYLRRAGINVTVAAVGKPAVEKSSDILVTGARNIQVSACTTVEKVSGENKLDPSAWDAVVVPGGLPGADNIAACGVSGDFIKAMSAAGKLTAAICASPARVLSPLGLLAGKNFTCYPGQEERVFTEKPASSGAVYKSDPVVVDGTVITSRSAGTAGVFSIAIVAYLLGEAEAKSLAEKLLL